MQTSFQNQLAIDESRSADADIAPPAQPGSLKQAEPCPIAFDGQHDQTLWQRLVSTLYQARIWSAQREIDRHQDTIQFWRRGLAQRRAHLRPVTTPAAGPDNAVVESAGKRAFRTFAAHAAGTLMNVDSVAAAWRRRSRLRRELLALSDSDLRDIRWTRAEVEAEGRKPFWRP